MSLDNLSGMPDWDDQFFEDDNEGEEWKPRPTRDAAKAMYEQWKQVMILLKGAVGDMGLKKADENDDAIESELDADYRDDMKGMLLSDAHMVAVKIRSSEAGLYMLRMENACLIRMYAQSIQSSMFTKIAEGFIDEAHGMVIREEIDKFKLLFKYWVSTFERDEFEDEWGLF
ncbi:MAG TPA: hypothetical protein PKM98_09525 [Chitinophagaceae bacterium]|nr:hypothetical protein [Chitinophagaceae bacterium]